MPTPSLEDARRGLVVYGADPVAAGLGAFPLGAPEDALQSPTFARGLQLYTAALSATEFCLVDARGRPAAPGSRRKLTTRARFACGLFASYPNNEQTWPQFLSAVAADLLLHGNAYARLRRDGDGLVLSLDYIAAAAVAPGPDPRRVLVPPSPGAGRVVFAGEEAATEPLALAEMLHLAWTPAGGRRAPSPVSEHMAPAIMEEREQAMLSVKETRAGGALAVGVKTGNTGRRYDDDYTPDESGEAGRAKQRDGILGGLRRALKLGGREPEGGATAIEMEKEAELVHLTRSASERRTPEMREAARLEIARAMGVPTSLLGFSASPAAGALAQGYDGFLRTSITPLRLRLAAALQRALLGNSETARDGWKVRWGALADHDLESLAKLSANSGILTPAEVRAAYGLPFIEGSDEMQAPKGAAAPAAPGEEGANGRPPGGGNPEGEPTEAEAAAPPPGRVVPLRLAGGGGAPAAPGGRGRLTAAPENPTRGP